MLSAFTRQLLPCKQDNQGVVATQGRLKYYTLPWVTFEVNIQVLEAENVERHACVTIKSWFPPDFDKIPGCIL